MTNYIKIMTDSAIIINRIASLLHEHHIATQIKDNVESGRLAGFGVPQNDVELYIPEAKAEKAQALIEQFQKESTQ